MRVPKPKSKTRPCECGGRLQPTALESFDFSKVVSLPVTFSDLPGYRCDRCGQTTIEGSLINALTKHVLVMIAKLPRRLTADEARFLRRGLGVTQQELATRMGVVRVTVGKWETTEEISAQHDMIIRMVVLAPMVAIGAIPSEHMTQLANLFQSVRTAPPAHSEAFKFASPSEDELMQYAAAG